MKKDLIWLQIIFLIIGGVICAFFLPTSINFAALLANGSTEEEIGAAIIGLVLIFPVLLVAGPVQAIFGATTIGLSTRSIKRGRKVWGIISLVLSIVITLAAVAELSSFFIAARINSSSSDALMLITNLVRI